MFGKSVSKHQPLVPSVSRDGFTFIELVIVMAIVGILLSIAIPNFMARRPAMERKQFVDKLNSLIQVAWQDAVVTHKLHRITFDIGKRVVSVEVQTGKQAATDEKIFAPMTSQYLSSTYQWPENFIEIINFYVNRRDEFKLSLDYRGKGKIWFFITPDGLAQPVEINLIDLKEGQKPGMQAEFALVLNPFTAQFKEYDTFQKP